MTGPETGSPPSGPRVTELSVRNANAYTALVDTFVAAQLRHGFRPAQLDRNGRIEATR